MIYILFVLIIILFVNILLFSQLENNNLSSEASPQEALGAPSNAKLEKKIPTEKETEIFEEPVYSNLYLAARAY